MAPLVPLVLLLIQLNEVSAASSLRGQRLASRASAASLDAASLRPDAAHLARANETAAAWQPGTVVFNSAADDAVRLSADSVITFLTSVASSRSPSAPAVRDYLPDCESQLQMLVEGLDVHYTDAQLKTVLANECINQKQFPHVYESGLKTQKVCRDFAEALVKARDEHVFKTGSTSGYRSFCKDFYEQKFGKIKANVGEANCPCVGFDGLDGDTKIQFGDDKIAYPADLGGSCQAWDDQRHPACTDGETPGPGNGWCAQQWCYVDPCNCDLAVPPKTSSYLPDATYQGKPVYFSYATCGSHDEWTEENYGDACVMQKDETSCVGYDKCAWKASEKKCLGKELLGACEAKVDEKVAPLLGSQGCKCVGIYNQTGSSAMLVEGHSVGYPADAGSACKAWDFNTHPKCTGGSIEPWCVQAWCYVDPCECDLPVPPKVSSYLPDTEFQNKDLYFSYATCGGEDSYTASAYPDACVNQRSADACGQQAHCAWTGEKCLGKDIVQACPGQAPAKAEKKEAPKEEEPSDFGSPKCPCVGFEGVDGDTLVTLSGIGDKVVYPAELGGECKAWDNNVHPSCEDGAEPGPDNGWCAQKWCYVDPCSCELETLPKTSSYLPGATYQGKPVYYSYATCGGKDDFTAENAKEACVNQASEDACAASEKCAWDGKRCLGKELVDACDVELNATVVGHADCRCVGIANYNGTTVVKAGGKKLDYPADTGASCEAWDSKQHPDCKGDGDLPEWCGQAWCYVDPCECTLPVPPKTSSYVPDASFQDKPLYYSYATCGSKDAWTKESKDACVNLKSEDACRTLAKCAWAVDKCLGKELVEKCPAVEAKKEEQPEQAPPPAVVAPPTIGSPECPCVGFDNLDGETEVTIDGEKVGYPADLGGTCQAWDDKTHPSCMEGETPGPHNGWCAQKWCYVDPCNCGIETLPKTSSYLPSARYQGKPVYYSYATCGGTDEWTAENYKEACVNQDSESACIALDACAWDGEKCGGKEVLGACKVKFPPEQIGSSKCRCIGIDQQPGKVDVQLGPGSVEFPASLGASCHPWDLFSHPECQVENPADWCSKSWCYVDPCECDLAIPPKTSAYLPETTFQEKPLYFSYMTCGYDDTWTKDNHEYACANQVTEDSCNALAKCAWAADKCLGKDIVSKCPAVHEAIGVDYGKDGCQCVGFDGVDGKTDAHVGDGVVRYPADLGASCKAWDDDFHPDCKEGGEGKPWCKLMWCYVDPCTCTSVEMPEKSAYLPGSSYQGNQLYYSYETCGNPDPAGHEASCDALKSEATCSVDKCLWTGQECVIKATAKECAAHDQKHNTSLEGMMECHCVGLHNVSGTTEITIAGQEIKYPADVGASCQAWDKKLHPQCAGDSPPSWCAQTWCFVDPCTCKLPLPPVESVYFAGDDVTYKGKPLYFSYATCTSEDTFSAENNKGACSLQKDQASCSALTECGWDGGHCILKELLGQCGSEAPPALPAPKEEKKLVLGNKQCPCIGFNSVEGHSNVSFAELGTVDYPADLGASCEAWDNFKHPSCQMGGKPGAGKGWCRQSWCYVDPCNCNIDVLPKVSAYYENATFQGHALYYSYETCEGEDMFTAEHHPDACVNQANYHDCVKDAKCAWDGEKCGGKELLDTCDDAVDVKVVGQDSCRCIGIANQTGELTVSLGATKEVYPADTGAFCKAWDDGLHTDCKGENPPSWCEEKWCFVDPCECDLLPKNSIYLADGKWGRKPVYFSYETCGSQDEFSRENYVTACAHQETQPLCNSNPKCKWNEKLGKCLGKDIGFFC